MKELEILTALIERGMSLSGACAMAGNMMAESGLKANIAQRGMTALSDEQYTQASDAGTVNFVNDSVGYGLCQWTYPTRKQALLMFAKMRGVSVGDAAMQLEFCVEELKRDYGALWEYLRGTAEIYEAAARICIEYERPAVNNIEVRAAYAQELYTKYGGIIENGELRMENENDTQFSIENAMPPITEGRTPEAKYLAALLKGIGYDVLWFGLENCVKDFQQKTALEVDGICGKDTWRKLMEVKQ